MSDFKKITKFIVDFRNARNWGQFHNPKDLAIALSIEAAELNELFLWKNQGQLPSVNRERVSEELADILVYALFIAERYDFDIEDIIMSKMKKNAEKYTVEKSKNLATKYTEL
nr:nucleotide pyrophosphohydrolase [Bacteroidota bacterium]